MKIRMRTDFFLLEKMQVGRQQSNNNFKGPKGEKIVNLDFYIQQNDHSKEEVAWIENI